MSKKAKFLYNSDSESEPDEMPEEPQAMPEAPLDDDDDDSYCGLDESELSEVRTYKLPTRIPRKKEEGHFECSDCGRIYKRQVNLTKHKCPSNIAPRPKPEPIPPPVLKLIEDPPKKQPKPKPKPKPRPKKVIVYESSSSSDDYSSSEEEPEIVYRRKVPFQPSVLFY